MTTNQKQFLIGALVATAMLAASILGWWPIATVETLGFISGGVAVWLTVRVSPWNWPVGLANNILFFVLFWQGRLFGDAGLQVAFFALGVYGWVHWLRGGPARTTLPISRTPRYEWIFLAVAVPVATAGLFELLQAHDGAAPFWDALTTVLSLAAQYLLGRKRIENWFIWIAADLIYIPLYISRDLWLIAALYGVFLAMCVLGLREWRGQLRRIEAGDGR